MPRSEHPWLLSPHQGRQSRSKALGKSGLVVSGCWHIQDFSFSPSLCLGTAVSHWICADIQHWMEEQVLFAVDVCVCSLYGLK